MAKLKFDIKKNFLEQKYIQENLSCAEIAKIIGCDDNTIHRALKKHEITTRTRECSLEEIRSAFLEFQNFELLDLKNNVCTIKNKTSGKVFTGQFSYIHSKLKINPDWNFGSTNEERAEAVKKTNIKRYGVVSTSSLPEVRKKQEAARIKNGFQTKFDGKSVNEICEHLKTPIASFYLNLKRFGYDHAVKYAKSGKTDIENVISDFLKAESVDFISNKVLGSGLTSRPDFLIKDKKIIIECNGLFWHSDQHLKDKNHHKKRQEDFKKAGYDSLFFSADEILNKKEIVFSIIRNKIQKNKNKKFARKLDCVKLDTDKFFDENHLMGHGKGVVFALVDKEGTIWCAIQVKWKNKHEKILEVSRFCTAINSTVVGGFDKLIKHSIKQLKPKNIITFIDRRYGFGEYLSGLGWKKESENLSFKWTDMKSTFHRMKFPGNTGYENKMAKIWDCGQAKWVLNV